MVLPPFIGSVPILIVAVGVVEVPFLVALRQIAQPTDVIVG
jgi:hypothetical protein